MARFLSRIFGHSGTGSEELSAESVHAALPLVRKMLPPSPLTRSFGLSELTGRDVFLKWENKFTTGSFKERGAVHALSRLSIDERSRGVCAASAGNHALALSYHARQFGAPCTIVMPRHAALIKIQSTKGYGAEVILHGESFDDAAQHARQLAAERSLSFIPAFDAPSVVAGQGTVGLELLEQLTDVDAVIVPIGGGGLISGIALAVKQAKPDCFVLGVRSEWAVSHRTPGAPAPLMLADTSLADGIAVKHPGSVTEPLIAKLVDSIAVASEMDIAHAIIRFLEIERAVVEGAGAVGLWALTAGKVPERYKRVAIIVSGSNIDVNVLSRLIEWDMGERDRLVRLNVSVPDRPGSLSAVSGIIAQLGANVLEVHHDRNFSRIPGNVDIAFLIEVRNQDHKREVIETLNDRGITVEEI